MIISASSKQWEMSYECCFTSTTTSRRWARCAEREKKEKITCFRTQNSTLTSKISYQLTLAWRSYGILTVEATAGTVRNHYKICMGFQDNFGQRLANLEILHTLLKSAVGNKIMITSGQRVQNIDYICTTKTVRPNGQSYSTATWLLL